MPDVALELHRQRGEKMVYTIIQGVQTSTLGQSRETATAALELVKELRDQGQPIVKITDRNGNVLTVSDLEKLSDQENI